MAKKDDPSPAKAFPPGLSIREIIEKHFKVEAKVAVAGTKIIPFILNEDQAELDDSLDDMLGTSCKEHVIPKPRQRGISTYILARFLVKCLTIPGTHAVVVSHESLATKRLLRKVQFFLDHLKEDGFDVPTKFNNVHEKAFPNGSTFYIGTAGQRAFSRGDTVTDVHCSEVAHWPDPEALISGLVGAAVEGSEWFFESTGFGAGGYFYNLVRAAQKPGATIKLHFPDWRKDETYVKEPPKDFETTEEEKFLTTRFNLTPAQVYWRRSKIEKFNSVDIFCQEYPLTVEECFISTGTSYFDKTSLRLYQRLIREPHAVGVLEDVAGRSMFQRQEDGWLRVYEYPKPQVEFLIAADCSEGLEDPAADDAVAQVVNRSTFSQAAVLSGRIDPSDMAAHLFNLGRYYNYPWIAVEDNGPGLTVLTELRRLGYPRLYKRRSVEIDSQQETERWGWHTDLRTRPVMLGELRSVLKRQAFLTRDERLLQQCTTFCRQKDGGYKANYGCHDDHVMSAAIAAYLHKILPYVPPEEERFMNHWAQTAGRDDGSRIVRNSRTGY